MKFDDILRDRSEVVDDHFIVTFEVEGKKRVEDIAWAIALGQSVGNPEVRNEWETKELFEKHCCKVVNPRPEKFNDIYPQKPFQGFIGKVDIAFPVINTNWLEDGIAHMICQIMGGQVDIEYIRKCRAIDIYIPPCVEAVFLKPKYGLSGMRDYVKSHNVPLFGGIMKPKTGLTPQQMLDMTKQMVGGGVDFIKEDEILSNPMFCPLEKRVELIANFRERENHKFVFAHCINGDPHVIAKRALTVADLGGNGVHINIWSGLGSYNTIRQLDLPLYLHYQKSGDKVITHRDNAFGISWKVLVKIAALCGVDTIHTGMWGGYLDDDEVELEEVMKILTEANVVPALSCGMHPGLVEKIRTRFGIDWMANVGGAIHGHPRGTEFGALAMRQAIDREYMQAYGEAVNKWGIAK